MHPQPTTTPERGGTLRRSTLTSVARRLEASRSHLARDLPSLADSVREIVLVASSSRSGSSFLAELLGRSAAFWHFPGEINPYLRLTGLAWPDSGTSDSLVPRICTSEAMRSLRDHLALDGGSTTDAHARDLPINEFDEDLYIRLCLQWPLEEFNLEEVSAARVAALSEVERICNRQCNWSTDLHLFHALFLRRIRVYRPVINPYYYDLDRTLVKELYPDVEIPAGPPSQVIVEEPPFILVRPRVRWQPANIGERPILIKTPSNAYRLEFLRSLFPSAQFRILHLTRNPAASINGIYEGWYHWGFHSHYVGPDLQIPVYSDEVSADREWWKFDLPPGWEAYCHAPVEQICAFQWSEANRAILDFVQRNDVDYMRVRFEDLCNGNPGRLSICRELSGWLGIAEDRLLATLSLPLPYIMATKGPRAGRWRENAAILERVIDHPTIRSLATTLGYKDKSEWL